MKRIIFFFGILIGVLLCDRCIAQEDQAAHLKKMEQLNAQLQKTSSDTARIRLYLELCLECDIADNLKYAEPVLALTDKLLAAKPDQKLRATLIQQRGQAFNYISVYYQETNQYDKALSFLGKALEQFEKTNDKEGKAAVYEGLINVYNDQNHVKKKVEYMRKRIELLDELNDLEGMKDQLTQLANHYSYEGSVLKEMGILKEGLELFKKKNHPLGQARFLNMLKDLYRNQGDTVQALEYLQRFMALEKSINDSVRIARSYFLGGSFYYEMELYPQALNYLDSAVYLYAIRKDTLALLELNRQIGQVYLRKNEPQKGLEYFQKCLQFKSSKQEYLKLYFEALISIGNAYRQMNDNEKALEYHLKAFKFVEPYPYRPGKMLINHTLAKDYFLVGDFKKAKFYADKALEIALEAGSASDKMWQYQYAYKVDSALGNGNEAFQKYHKYIFLRDLLKNEEVRRSAAKDKYQSDLEAEKTAAKVERERKEAEQAAQTKKQRVILGSVLAGLLLVGIFAGFILRSLRITRKQKVVIEEKNKLTEEQKHIIEEKQTEILDSINYAQRIQGAMLPPITDITAAYSDSFVLFKPKDIVSGDFYWFDQKDGKTFIAAADCTGHGVPGAIMSMVGAEKLNEALAHSTDVSEILSLLNKGIKKALRQSGNADATRDGMDIALCSFSKDLQQLEYAGANRPLWIIRKGTTEIEETKATKTAIGGLTDDEQEFTKRSVTLQKGDSVYIFSDGYADQFSPEDKKLMTRKFKDLLLSSLNKSMEEQKEFLGSFIDKWKGNMEQTDDILVIGIRV